MSAMSKSGRRGGPLAVLFLLIGVWAGARAVLWESPFPVLDLPVGDLLFAEKAHTVDQGPADPAAQTSSKGPPLSSPQFASDEAGSQAFIQASGGQWSGIARGGHAPAVAAGHLYLLNAAFAMDWHSDGLGGPFGTRQPGLGLYSADKSPPPFFAAQPGGRQAEAPDRWSLDSFLYYRPGSGSLSTSQGRAPVYGASQAAAILQYRMAPNSGHDPRGYLRAYHAIVNAGETELAAGLSARPLSGLPLRVAGEVRATRNPQGTDYRPAGYAVTEIPPQRLPLRFSLEAYGAAGYVGGKADTYFAEGQASVTREVVSFEGPTDQPMRLSVGGAAWGGAQKSASRVDIGPTVRLDLSLGEVPARISLDWRERVAGDAVPDSGIAATVSTRF